uniref:ABC-type xenobiotic transporter n=1 Tax=Strigamia maritima TaxID=126957 RepID=T1JCV2_STRMM
MQSSAKTTLASIRTVAAFSGEAKEIQRFGVVSRGIRLIGEKRGWVCGLILAAMALSKHIAFSIAYWYGTNLTLDTLATDSKEYTAKEVYIVLFSAFVAALTTSQLIPYVVNIRRAAPASIQALELLQTKSTIDSSSSEGLQPQPVEGTISFENVLTNFSLQVQAGDTVAIVGPSKSGKTTILQLLQRFYDPTSGQISLEGHNLRDLNVSWLRGQVAFVDSLPILFSTTIRENIRYGRQNATLADIELAAVTANAHEFIVKLPQQYNTIVGEYGTILTDSQKQRVAIARALIRNPKILLLDGATAKLDAEPDSIVSEALEKARESRTTFLVPYRISSITHIDNIVVMSNGKVVEMGDHASLMQQKGVYYQQYKNEIKNDKPEIPEWLEDDDDEIERQIKEGANGDPTRAESERGRLYPVSRIRLNKHTNWMDASEFRVTPTLLRLLNTSSPYFFFAAMGLLGAFAVGLLFVVFTVILGHYLGLLAHNVDKIRSLSKHYSIVTVVVGFFGGLFAFLQNSFFAFYGERVSNCLRKQMFTSMMHQEMNWFDDPLNNPKLLSIRLHKDPLLVKEMLTAALGKLVQIGAMTAAAALITVIYSWKIALVATLFAILVVFITCLQAKVNTADSTLQYSASEAAGKIASESLSYIKTLASLNAENVVLTQYKTALERVHSLSLDMYSIRGLLFGIMRCAPLLLYSAVNSLGGYLIMFYNLPHQKVIVIQQLTEAAFFAMAQAVPLAFSILQGLETAHRIFRLLDRRPRIDSSVSAGFMLVSMSVKSYNWPKYGFKTRASKRQSSKAPFGLMCFASALKLMDQIDMQNLNVPWLRSQMAVISHDSLLHHRTITENIAYGDNMRRVKLPEIEQATKAVHIHTFIKTLPKGYDTVLGDCDHMLTNLQKFQISAARAILRKPKIILVDDVLLTKKETRVRGLMDVLDNIKNGRTCVLVSQSVLAAKSVDWVVVLRNTVLESGTPTDLLDRDSHFSLQWHREKQSQSRRTSVKNISLIDSSRPELYTDMGFDRSGKTIKRRTNHRTAFASLSLKRTISLAKSSHQAERKTASTLVNVYKILSHASFLDKILLLCGCAVAIINGICWPLFNYFLASFAQQISELLTHKQLIELIEKSPAINCSMLHHANYTNLTLDDQKICNLSLSMEKDNFQIPIADEWNQSIIYFTIPALLTGLLELITGYLMVLILNFTSERIVFHLKKLYFKNLLKQDICWFDTRSQGELTSSIMRNLSLVQVALGEKLGTFLMCTSEVLVSLIFCFWNGWKLTLVMSCLYPILFGLGKFNFQMKINKMIRVINGELAGIVQEVLGAIRTVFAFSGEAVELERFTNRLQATRSMNIKQGVAAATNFSFTLLIIQCFIALGFWYGVQLITSTSQSILDIGSEYTVENVLVIVTMTLMSGVFIRQAVPLMEMLNGGFSAATDIINVIERKPVIDTSDPGGKILQSLTGNIEFQSVHFWFPSSPGERRILRGLNLKIKAGETVALVGPSGGGKSTILQLIQRFYDPQKGKVKVDGTPLTEFNIGWFTTNIGVVSQEPCLFDTTIRENIRFGNQNATEEEIIYAAKEANAHDFILKLPLQYETVVGGQGSLLSGGQRQRIAIARALVRNPSILLLDEATSALDNESEVIVQESLDKARDGRTVIIIAHRLTTIRNVDRIVAVKAGRVVEQGTHDELMDKEGVYYQLLQTQSGQEKTVESSKEEEDEEDDEESEQQSVDYELDDDDDDDDVDDFLFPLDALQEDEDGTIRNQQELRHSFWKMFAFSKSDKLTVATVIIFSILYSLSHPARAFIFGKLTNTVVLRTLQNNAYLIVLWPSLYVVVGVLAFVSVALKLWAQAIAEENLLFRIRRRILEAILQQEIGWFDEPAHNVGNLCTMVTIDAENIKKIPGAMLGTWFYSVVAITTLTSISYWLQWKLALAISSLSLTVFVCHYLRGKIDHGMLLNLMTPEDHANNLAIEAVRNFRTVVSLHIQEKMCTLYNDSLGQPRKLYNKQAQLRSLVVGLSEALPLFGFTVSLAYGAYLMYHNQADYSTFNTINSMLIINLMEVSKVLSATPSYSKACVSANKIFKLLKRKPLIDNSRDAGIQMPAKMEPKIEFRDVCFSYPTRTNDQILKNVNLLIENGQTVAFVGTSGCGKSTSMQLLQRFYDPTSGGVALNGYDIRCINVPSLRSLIGLVSQEPVLFNRTIAENISYGNNERKVCMHEVVDAAQKANIHEFITSLRQGYETRVGARGVQLSGGQKQRVAIARALIKNPKILLLDEATSALDNESEKIVQESLEKAQEGRTCIIIAHRLSTIQNVDKIVVFSHGQIVEQGTQGIGIVREKRNFKPLEYILIFLGFLSAIVLGLSVPCAVFYVGEVVTLFITNRRARLSVLFQEGKHHTDYEAETDTNIHTLAHEIDESVHFAQSHINSSFTLTAHNHTLKEELNLNFQLNYQFEASLHTFCFCLLFVSVCQLLKRPTFIKFKRGYGSVTSQLLDTLQALPTVVAFNQENAEVTRYKIQLNNLTKYIQKNALISGLINGMITMFSHLINAIMLWYGVKLIIKDLRSGSSPFKPGTLVVIFFSFLRGLSTFIQAIPHYPMFKDSIKATARLRKTLKFGFYQNDGLLIPTIKLDQPQTPSQKPTFLSAINGLLVDKTAIERLVLHNSSSQNNFPIENQKQEFSTLKYIFLFWPYVFFGCLGSIVLGSTIPATFYIFCEIIGSMANLEDEIVFDRTTHMLGAFSILAISTLIATILQHYMLQVLGYLYSNKLRTTLLMSYFTNYKAQTIENFNLLSKENVSDVEIAVTSVLGTGVEILSAVLVALPLAASVVWSQALILSYIFPTLFAIYFLQYVTEKKEIKNSSFAENVSESLRNSLLWGFVRAFREMAFSTILFFGTYLIIHHGENNKNVLQVNLIMINTALQINQLNAVGFNVKKGWKAARNIEKFFLQSKFHLRNQSQASIPTSPLQVTLIDAQFGQPLVVNLGQKCEIAVDNKKKFFRSLLSGQFSFERQMLISYCNIRDVNSTWMRRNIALISEEIQFLFPSRTLFENVCYGRNSDEKSFDVIEDLSDFQDWDSVLNAVSPKIISSYHKILILSRCLSRKCPIIIADEDYATPEIKHEANQLLIIIKQK